MNKTREVVFLAKTGIMVLAVSALFGIQVLYAMSAGTKGAQPRDRHDHVYFMKALDLSEEQAAKVKEIKDASKTEVDSHKKAIDEATLEIREEIKNENPDREKISRLTETISENQKKLMMLRNEHMFLIKETLTNEQFDKMMDIMEKHGERRGKFDGKRKDRKF
ncbi:MAG TPA: periplasmic heavy metal sensor [bacterium]|nr:periplasmic heavy metal sensor [bacterium]